MDLTGEQHVPAPREAVWRALNDPEILRRSVPGCEEIEKVSETEFVAKVTTKIGPVKIGFTGRITLSDLDPPHGYRISGEGQGGAAGFAKGEAEVRLAPDETGRGTILTYRASADVGGKLAQIGSRLIEGTAQKLVGEFFESFATAVGGPTEEAPEGVPPGAAIPKGSRAERPALPPAVWISGLIVIVFVLLLLFAL